MDTRYFQDLAAAFVRGALPQHSHLSDPDLIQTGRQEGLRLHKFKITNLPRVQKTLGILKGLQPNDLLDIGSGRGTFLWPLLHQFPQLPVTAVDMSERRVKDLTHVIRGGVHQLQVIQADAQNLPFPDQSQDVITALEVLEHLPNPHRAAAHLVRIARRFIVASVPSKPDDNPEHIQFFTNQTFQNMFLQAGATKVRIEYVPGHMIAVVTVT